MAIRVGRVPYLHCEPFYFDMARRGIELYDMTPAALSIAAAQVLHVLLRLKYQVQPAAYVPLDATHEAFLLTGNEALRRRMGARGFPHLYDLGHEWHAWTGLPFVFSCWMVRKDVAAKDRALLL